MHEVWRWGDFILRRKLGCTLRIFTLRGDSCDCFLNRYLWKGGWYCFVCAINCSLILRSYMLKCCLGWLWLLVHTISQAFFMLFVVQQSLGLPTLRFVVSLGIADVVEKVTWCWGCCLSHFVRQRPCFGPTRYSGMTDMNRYYTWVGSQSLTRRLKIATLLSRILFSTTRIAPSMRHRLRPLVALPAGYPLYMRFRYFQYDFYKRFHEF